MKWFLLHEPAGQYRGGLRRVTKLSRVRELRRQPTPAEGMLREVLRNRQFLGLKFRRQHQYGSYILDFVCAELQFVIELDGGVHDDPAQQVHDRERDRFLHSHQLHIVRFPNRMILHTLEATLKQLEMICRGIDEGGQSLICRESTSPNDKYATAELTKPDNQQSAVNLTRPNDNHVR